MGKSGYWLVEVTNFEAATDGDAYWKPAVDPTLQEAMLIGANGDISHRKIPGAITPIRIEFDDRVFTRVAMDPPYYEEIAS